MAKAESTGSERRTAKRYRVPGSARVFWDGEGAPVSIADMSAGGCLLTGEHLPEVGTRVFLSLDVGGLPNVRLPATTVRREDGGGEQVAAVRFDVPTSSVGGLDKLLAQFVQQRHSGLSVLVLDTDARSRARVGAAVRAMGAEVVCLDPAHEATDRTSVLSANLVLARADSAGIAALEWLSQTRPSTFRVAFGRKSAIEAAVAGGLAQASADDPCSAKCLGELLRKRRLDTSS